MEQSKNTHRHFIMYKPYGYLSQFYTNAKKEQKKKFLGDLYDFPKNAMAIGRLDEKSEGIYIILSDKFNFFYVGKTLANIKQRLHSHIQKLTSTNNNRYTTPLKWQKLAFNRYNALKEDSVKLEDLKIKFYHSSEYSSCKIDKLENDIYLKYKALLPKYISLNDPKALEK